MPATGFLAAFWDVVMGPSGLKGESWSISGRLTGTGIEGMEPLTDDRDAEPRRCGSAVRGARCLT